VRSEIAIEWLSKCNRLYICMLIIFVRLCLYVDDTFACMLRTLHDTFIHVQPIPLGVTFSNAVSKLKAQSSNVSFH